MRIVTLLSAILCATTATAGGQFGCLRCISCGGRCVLQKQPTTETDSYFAIEQEQVCIPSVRLPWDCGPREPGRTRYVNRMIEKTREVPTTAYEWVAVCPRCGRIHEDGEQHEEAESPTTPPAPAPPMPPPAPDARMFRTPSRAAAFRGTRFRPYSIVSQPQIEIGQFQPNFVEARHAEVANTEQFVRRPADDLTHRGNAQSREALPGTH